MEPGSLVMLLAIIPSEQMWYLGALATHTALHQVAMMGKSSCEYDASMKSRATFVDQYRWSCENTMDRGHEYRKMVEESIAKDRGQLRRQGSVQTLAVD